MATATAKAGEPVCPPPLKKKAALLFGPSVIVGRSKEYRSWRCERKRSRGELAYSAGLSWRDARRTETVDRDRIVADGAGNFTSTEIGRLAEKEACTTSLLTM